MTTESGVRPAAPSSTAALVKALVGLRDVAGGLRFSLPIAGAVRAAEARTELVSQLDDYLLPRLRRLDAPLLTVVGGSTGAGKSTVVNSLVRAPVSPAGVLRPTTRSPVLVCHPYDLHWFSDARILPELTRTGGTSADHRTLQLVSSSTMDPGLAFLDAPDIDSVVAQNRRLAGQLLAAADLWLFVTTAARYADAVPWEILRTAQSRGTALAVLLDRVPLGAEDEVREHLREMLREHRLGAAPLFVVPEVRLVDSLLPEPIIASLRGWLEGLARDGGHRAAVVRHTLDGALTSLRPRTAALAAQAAAQLDAAQRLREEAGAAYDAALSTIDTGLRDGTPVHGEVLTRWREFVGTGALAHTAAARLGRWRERLTAALTSGPPPGQELEAALISELGLLVGSAAEWAAEDAAGAWRADPAGAGLLRDSDDPLARPSPGFRAATERALRDWQAQVQELGRRDGGARGSTAMGAATGLLVMIAVLVAPDLGDRGLRRLAEDARADLLERVAELLDQERARYDALLAAHAPDAGAAARLNQAVAAVEHTR